MTPSSTSIPMEMIPNPPGGGDSSKWLDTISVHTEDGKIDLARIRASKRGSLGLTVIVTPEIAFGVTPKEKQFSIALAVRNHDQLYFEYAASPELLRKMMFSTPSEVWEFIRDNIDIVHCGPEDFKLEITNDAQ